jgi:hypothetical protein
MEVFMLTMIIPILAAAVMQSQPQQVDASTLPKVAGPMPPRYADPASDSYSSAGGLVAIRSRARGNKLSALALPEGDIIVSDKIENTAGRQAYQVIVPADNTVKVSLKAKNQDLFLVRVVNSAGNTEKGMTQNLLNKFDSEASYTNKSKKAKTIYFIVDTNELDMLDTQYTLQITWK